MLKYPKSTKSIIVACRDKITIQQWTDINDYMVWELENKGGFKSRKLWPKDMRAAQPINFFFFLE